jgi:hypothetical protein
VIEVKLVTFPGHCGTRLWLSQRAAEGLAEFRKKGDPNGAFWKKVQRMARVGFRYYEGSRGMPIRPEGGGVYRIGIHGSLFRIVGFFKDESRSDFIGVDVFLKSGQDLSRSERDRIDAVAKVKQNGSWKEVENGRYPRLAQ